MSSPDDLTPQEAVDRFLAKRTTDATERTIESYEYRLKHFVDWCEAEEIETVGELDPWHIDEYDLWNRQQDYAPTTVKGHLSSVKVLLDYLDRIGAVEDDLGDSVEVPNLSKGEESSDERLSPEDALASIRYMREEPAFYGRPMHAYLEVLWHTGARMGGIRGLDVGDYNAEEGYLAFRHRETTGTPLKNKEDGERLVGIPPETCDVLEAYIERERFDKRDEHGREPLFCARQGRPSFTTFRGWAYLATQPCLHTDCPHGNERYSCDYVTRNHASKCPSSRSPHRIRTGSITWQLNRGLDVEVVSARVNATPEVIRRFYDKATEVEQFTERRDEAADALSIDDGPTTDTPSQS